MIQNKMLREEIKRKLFHLIGLVYVVGLVYLPRATFLILLSALLIGVSFVELIRSRAESINEWLFHHFGGLFREKEREKLSGVFWMMLGVLFATVISPSLPLAMASVLYLVFGDAAASLIGKWLKGPRWWRSDKSMSGSLGCFLVCIIIGAWILKPEFSWGVICLGAIAATVGEIGLSPSVDDNFGIPALVSLVFFFTL